MFSRRLLFFLPLLLAGCADLASPLLRNVRALHSDGTLTAPLADDDLTPFQQLLRDRLPSQPPQPAAIFALEVDRPDGDGTEGEYLALLRSGSEIVLRFYEQEDHRPRADRFYYRQLTAVETVEFDNFFKAYSLADLQRPRPASAPSTQTATEPDTPPDIQPAAPSGEVPPGTPPDAPEATLHFRFTDARKDGTRTLVVQSPGKENHPVIDLVQMLARFRDAGAFASRYHQTIPLTARALFADPRQRVLYVWHKQDDLRIVVVSAQPNVPAAERWLAYKDGQWQPSAPPPEFLPPATVPATEPVASATEPTTEPATAPATEPAVRNYTNLQIEPLLRPRVAPLPDITPEQIRLMMAPRPLPEVESWWTEPNQNSTTVFHYIPQSGGVGAGGGRGGAGGIVRSQNMGMTLGFVVPAFQFDDDHFAVDAVRGTLYVVHDGQLFSLPIPPSALKPPAGP